MEITAIGSLATAVGVVVLAWQVWEARKAVEAQTRANELQIFADMNLKFLDIISNLGESINKSDVSETDLPEEARRTLDRWFYLANMEYIVHNNKMISHVISKQWIDGIASAAKKRVFWERWGSTASKFTLDPEFKKFFVESHGRSAA